ncbi:membrane protein required for colicin V production [Desulfovibrionales bacterium]
MLDIIFVVVAGFLVLRGGTHGLLVEVAALCGAIGGVFLANRYHLILISFIQYFLFNPDWAGIIAYLLIFFATLVLTSTVAVLVNKALTLIFVGWTDYLAGALLGAAMASFVCVVGVLLLQHFLPQSSLLRNSILLPYVQLLARYLKEILPIIFLPN